MNTQKQQSRQTTREKGKYKSMNVCEDCQKHLGDHDYFSLEGQFTYKEINLLSHLTNNGLILCGKCYNKNAALITSKVLGKNVFEYLCNQNAIFQIKNLNNSKIATIDYQKNIIKDSNHKTYQLEQPASDAFNILIDVSDSLSCLYYSDFELYQVLL